MGGLNVAVDKAVLVCVVERGCGLREPIECAVWRCCAGLAEDVFERAAREVLHDYERALVALTDVVNRDRIRMRRQLGRSPGLALKTLPGLRLQIEAIVEQLDRDDTTKRVVPGLIHLAHASTRDEASAFVAVGKPNGNIGRAHRASPEQYRLPGHSRLGEGESSQRPHLTGTCGRVPGHAVGRHLAQARALLVQLGKGASGTRLAHTRMV